MTYQDNNNIYLSRWQADPLGSAGIYSNTHTGMEVERDSLTVLDTYVTDYNYVTVMFADASLTDRASCKLVQFDLSTLMIRERTVSIYTDGNL